MVRTYTDWHSGTGLFSVVVFGLMVIVSTLGGGYVARFVGQELAAGTFEVGPVQAIEIARGVLAVAGMFGVLVVMIRAIGQRGTLEHAEGTLTMVPTAEAFLGVLLAEYVYVLLWLGGPAIGSGIGFALGTGRFWPVLLVPLAVAMGGGAIVALGYPLGLGVRHVVTRFEFVARHRAALLLVVFVGYIFVVATGSLNAAVVALFEPMQSSPTGWIADLLLLGTPAVADSVVRAAGAVGVAAVLTLLGVVVGPRIAGIHWFSDPALAGESEGDTEPGVHARSSVALPAVAQRVPLPTPTVALVVLAWQRAVRSPMKLLYAAYPLLFVVGALAEIYQSGQIPAYLPYGVLVFAAWAAGVLFTLNPLGDQGAVLPTTILSRVDGRRFVRAHLLASLVVAVPLGMLATGVVAVFSPLDPLRTWTLVAVTPVALVVSSVTSVGIGMAFPRFRAVSITRSMKVVVPSLVSFVLFSLYLGATILAGLTVDSEAVRTVGAALVSALLPFGLDIAPETLVVVAGVALVALVAVPAISYRYAVRAFDGYTLE